MATVPPTPNRRSWLSRLMRWLTFQNARREHREFSADVDANVKRIDDSIEARKRNGQCRKT